MKRSAGADRITLSVRLDAASPWIEVTAAHKDDTASIVNLNRLQKIYTNPLVREIFLELNENS